MYYGKDSIPNRIPNIEYPTGALYCLKLTGIAYDEKKKNIDSPLPA